MTIEKQLAELESLHRIQVENGRHYFWVKEDDALASMWQGRADETKKEILKLKSDHNIDTPNWWE